MSNKKDLLKEAIADAKAVRSTAIANAKLALEEAFTPKLQSMLSNKIAEEMDDEMEDDEEVAVDMAMDAEETEESYNETEDMEETESEEEMTETEDDMDETEEIDEMGGVVPGIEQGWFQQEIANSAMRQQREVESAERVVVGVNHFTEGSGDIEIETLRIDPEVEERQVAKMADMRVGRDDAAVSATLTALTEACRADANVVPYILECARTYCTLFEIRAAMEEVFGSYKEPVFF